MRDHVVTVLFDVRVPESGMHAAPSHNDVGTVVVEAPAAVCGRSGSFVRPVGACLPWSAQPNPRPSSIGPRTGTNRYQSRGCLSFIRRQVNRPPTKMPLESR